MPVGYVERAAGVREIPLTQGRVALVDEADLPLVCGVKWQAHNSRNDPGGECWYAAGFIGHSHATRLRVYMHRLILGVPRGQEVDHRNGNGLDNRRENLRVCSRGQNAKNLGKIAAATSRFRGVSWSHDRREWRAAIAANRRRYFLGTFSSEPEAARAYDAAAIRLHGPFARLNFPAGGDQVAGRIH